MDRITGKLRAAGAGELSKGGRHPARACLAELLGTPTVPAQQRAGGLRQGEQRSLNSHMGSQHQVLEPGSDLCSWPVGGAITQLRSW